MAPMAGGWRAVSAGGAATGPLRRAPRRMATLARWAPASPPSRSSGVGVRLERRAARPFCRCDGSVAATSAGIAAVDAGFSPAMTGSSSARRRARVVVDRAAL